MFLVRRMPEKPTRGDAAAAVTVTAIGIGVCVLLALAIGLGAGNCDAWYAIEGLCGKPQIALIAAVVIAALPLFTSTFIAQPLAAMLGLYIVLVPIDDALLVGSGLSVTKIIGLLIAIAAAVVMWRRRRVRTKIPSAIFGWLAVVALMGVSITWSIDPELSHENIVTIASAFALMLIVFAVPLNSAELRTVIIATIVSGAVVGTVALGMSTHDISQAAGQEGRLYLTFGTATLDPNRFGASLLLPIAMTAGAIVRTKGWVRLALFIPLGLALAAVYLVASRGTLLAIAAMGVVVILASRRRVILGSLLAVCTALVFLLPSELSKRLFEGTASTGTGRFDIWKVAIASFPDHWFVGTGQGSFTAAYDHSLFLAYQPIFLEWSRDPHNLIISTATELGIVGLVVLSVALILQFRTIRLIPPPYTWLRLVFAASMVGLLVAAMFVDVLATKFSWLLFMEIMLFAGLSADRRPDSS